MERHPTRSLALLILLAAALSACGDGPREESPPSAAGPAARWRRAADVARAGAASVIEALRPCRVSFAWRVESTLEGRETIDLAPGDAVRLTVAAVPSGAPEMLPAPETARVKGRTRANAFTLRYDVDGTGDRVRTDIVWTRDEEPWSRIVAATVPPAWLDLPTGVAIPVIAVGVSDIPDATGLRLDLAPPPRIASPRPFAPDDVVHVTALVLTIEPR